MIGTISARADLMAVGVTMLAACCAAAVAGVIGFPDMISPQAPPPGHPNWAGLAIGAGGLALICGHVLRVNSAPAQAFALKDSGGTTPIPRAAVFPLGWFLIFVAVLLARYRIGVMREPSVAMAMTSGALALIGVIVAVLFLRLLRRFVIDDVEILERGPRYTRRIPLAEIQDVRLHYASVIPTIVITRWNGTTTELFAIDLAVTPESLVAAISARLPTVQRRAP